MTFGLGEYTHADSVIVRWPSGIVDVLRSVCVDTTLTIVEGQSLPVAVEEEDGRPLPRFFARSQNFPNPFNAKTVIAFQLPVETHVSLRIYDLLGREVRTLVNGFLQAGFRKVRWDGKDEMGRDVASGVFFYRLKAGGSIETKAMVLLK